MAMYPKEKIPVKTEHIFEGSLTNVRLIEENGEIKGEQLKDGPYLAADKEEAAERKAAGKALTDHLSYVRYGEALLDCEKLCANADVVLENKYQMFTPLEVREVGEAVMQQFFLAANGNSRISAGEAFKLCELSRKLFKENPDFVTRFYAKYRNGAKETRDESLALKQSGEKLKSEKKDLKTGEEKEVMKKGAGKTPDARTRPVLAKDGGRG